jgi:matrixin
MARVCLTAILAIGLLLSNQQLAGAHRQSRDRSARAAHRNARAHPRAPRSPAPDPVVLATSVAERYWGGAPCGGQVAVHAYSPQAPGVDSETDGWVTFNSSLGPNELEAPASTYSECAVWLASWHWPTAAAADQDWNMFCLTVIHEMGHLLGYKHSMVPGSVMAPVFTDESSVPPICRSARPHVGGSRAARAARAASVAPGAWARRAGVALFACRA